MAVTLGQLRWETVQKSDRRGLKLVEERSSALCKQEIRLNKDDLLCWRERGTFNPLFQKKRQMLLKSLIMILIILYLG